MKSTCLSKKLLPTGVKDEIKMFKESLAQMSTTLRVSMVEPGPDPNAPDFRLPQADSEGDTEAGAGLISASHYSLKKKQLPLPLLASIVTA